MWSDPEVFHDDNPHLGLRKSDCNRRKMSSQSMLFNDHLNQFGHVGDEQQWSSLLRMRAPLLSFPYVNYKPKGMARCRNLVTTNQCSVILSFNVEWFNDIHF